MKLTSTLGALALVSLLAACAQDAPAPPVPAPRNAAIEGAADASRAAAQVVEVLSPGTFRVDGAFLDGEGLQAAFAPTEGIGADPILDPLVLSVPASLTMEDLMPAMWAVLQPPGHVNLTLRAIEGGRGRESTIPIQSGCMCRALNIYDGGVDALPHTSDTMYVFVTVRLDDEGVMRTVSSTYDAPGVPIAPFETFLPDHLPKGAPTDGEPLDLAELKPWFEALQAADIEPMLCIDYRTSLAAGVLVDALRAAHTVLGRRLVLGPNPREPELEEEDLELPGHDPDDMPFEEDE